MTKSEAAEHLCSGKFRAICRKMAGHSLGEDLFQETLMILMEYPQWEQIKCVECFFIKIASRQWYSSTSPFFYKYRKSPDKEMIKEFTSTVLSTEGGLEEMTSAIDRALKAETWYDRELFRLYALEGSARKVTKKTGIPFQSVALSVKRVRERVKAKLVIK